MIGPVSVRVARRSLTSKGFLENTSGRGDHYYFQLAIDGKKTRIYFKISFGATELRTDEIKNSARSNKMTGDVMHGILNCDIDAAATLREARAALDRFSSGS